MPYNIVRGRKEGGKDKAARRIFVALPISWEIQEEVKNWRSKYERLPVRWLAGKNLHITLVPPWYETDIPKVIAKLETAGKGISPFYVLFQKVEFGPDPRRPRLIWAEGEAPKEIENLKLKIENSLGRAPETRPWRLHLTLARFPSETFSSFPVKRLKEKVFWRDKVNSFVLMEAHLFREGADYEIVKEFTLG
jgi:2'-5' RNA ligase